MFKPIPFTSQLVQAQNMQIFSYAPAKHFPSTFCSSVMFCIRVKTFPFISASCCWQKAFTT